MLYMHSALHIKESQGTMPEVHASMRNEDIRSETYLEPLLLSLLTTRPWREVTRMDKNKIVT